MKTKKKMNKQTVARAVRVEIDPVDNTTYLVFKIIDESFKQKVRENWNNDVPVVVIGKDLIEES
jgi:hypothetical protein